MTYTGGGAGGANPYGRHIFTADETEVSEILLSLPNLIHSSESRYRVFVQWGQRRKRSVIGSAPEINQIKAKKASSPATPLSYPPSESDDKPKDRVKKISKKQTREELKNTVNELEKEQQFLRRELETACARHNQLVAYNAHLKAKQLEITQGFKAPVNVIERPAEVVMEKQESYGTKHDHKIHRSFVGPVGIPDLNLTVEDVSQPLDCMINFRDLIKVKSAAANARRTRMLRMREKMIRRNSSVSLKISSRC